MNAIIFFLSFLVASAAVIHQLNWIDRFHLVVGGGTAAVVLGVLLMYRWWQRGEGMDDEFDHENSPPVALAIFHGTLAAAVCTGASVGMFRIVERTPLAGFFDLDLKQTLAEVQVLEDNNAFADAASILSDRLEQPIYAASNRQRAVQRLLANYVAAGDCSPTRDEKFTFYTSALTTAQQHGLDERLAAARLEQFERRERLAARWDDLRADAEWRDLYISIAQEIPDTEGEDRADLVSLAIENFRDWIESTQADPERLGVLEDAIAFTQQYNEPSIEFDTQRSQILARMQDRATEDAYWAALRQRLDDMRHEPALRVGVVRDGMAAKSRDAWRLNLAELLVHDLVAVGDNMVDEVDRERKYIEAKETAVAYGVDHVFVEARLAALSDERARRLAAAKAAQQPVALPRGVTVEFTRPPVMTPDGAMIVTSISVEDQHGQPISGLAPKDFGASLAGVAADLTVVPVSQRQTPTHDAIFIMDRSSSMYGPPIAAAKQGMVDGIRAVRQLKVRARAMTFASSAKWVAEWDADADEVERQMTSIDAGGRTALFQSVRGALGALATRPAADRSIVLFTDGRDSSDGVTAAQVIDRARNLGVRIHAVGLRSPDLDVTALKQLTSATGGTYLEAASSEEIVERMLQATKLIRRADYELAIVPAAPSSESVGVTITVGGGDTAIDVTGYVTGSLASD